MKAVTLRAHFDGESLRLDEPCALDRDTPLTVTIRPRSEDTEDRTSWGLWAATSLAGAYTDDEPEYSPDLIKEPNPDYEGDIALAIPPQLDGEESATGGS